jgi:K+-transporting ATPase KdpF subunit
MRLPATGCEAVMILDYSLAALVTLGVLVYLVYALIRPERF